MSISIYRLLRKIALHAESTTRCLIFCLFLSMYHLYGQDLPTTALGQDGWPIRRYTSSLGYGKTGSLRNESLPTTTACVYLDGHARSTPQECRYHSNGEAMSTATQKASAAGACRKRVNPAYSSLTCPHCSYVHPKNRNEDKFVYLFYGWVGHSDRVGAHNLRGRMDDPEITLWMPKGQVRTILLSRLSRRTGEAPDWKPQGDCSGVQDSRHQVTTDGHSVGAETQVGGDGGMVRPVAVIDHPGQPESETAVEIRCLSESIVDRACSDSGKTTAEKPDTC